LMLRTGEEMCVAVIPAKLNSKRCPNKNWVDFMHDQSLAERKFLFSIGCGLFNHTVLSIDFPRNDVPFLDKPRNHYALTHSQGWSIRKRPRFLGDDSVDVVQDALESVKAQDQDIYCLLQPTSPFLRFEKVQEAIHAVQSNNQKVVGVNPSYKPNGALYTGYVRDLKTYGDFYRPLVMPLVMDWKESMDVDYDYDFQMARGLEE